MVGGNNQLTSLTHCTLMQQNYIFIAKKRASKSRRHTVQASFFSIYLYVCCFFGFPFTLCSHQPFFSPRIECWERARRRISALTNRCIYVSEQHSETVFVGWNLRGLPTNILTSSRYTVQISSAPRVHNPTVRCLAAQQRQAGKQNMTRFVINYRCCIWCH